MHHTTPTLLQCLQWRNHIIPFYKASEVSIDHDIIFHGVVVEDIYIDSVDHFGVVHTCFGGAANLGTLIRTYELIIRRTDAALQPVHCLTKNCVARIIKTESDAILPLLQSLAIVIAPRIAIKVKIATAARTDASTTDLNPSSNRLNCSACDSRRGRCNCDRRRNVGG